MPLDLYKKKLNDIIHVFNEFLMNIDIKTITDTISWFIVNPGAKERLVQITGTSEDKIQ